MGRHAGRSGLAAEVGEVAAHGLPATATALARGVPPLAVRNWLGHAILAATERYYRPAASDAGSPAVRVSYPKT